MKQYTAIFLVLILISSVFLSGCSKSIEEPDKVVEFVFESMRTTDVKAIAKYIDVEKVPNLGGNDYKSDESKALMSKLRANVLSKSVNGNEAIVKTEISALDIKSIVTKSISQKNKYSDSYGGDKTLLDLIKSEYSTVNSTVDIKLKKEKGVWKIELSDELKNAIGGVD